MSGRDFTDDLQCCGDARNIIGTQRISVHGGYVGRRLCDTRRNIGGEDARACFRERNVLRRQWLRALQDLIKRFRHRHQGHG
jgi:hypothetical protein